MATEVVMADLESKFNLPLAIGRLNPLPVDADYVKDSYALAANFAASDPTAYVGQLIYAKDTEKVYKIKKDGTLEELGGAAAVAAVEGRVSALETTVGNAESGLVKSVKDNKTSIENLNSTKLKNTTDTLTGTLSIVAGTGTGNEGDLRVARNVEVGESLSAKNLTLSGNLVVNGTTTTLNAENVSTKDNLIELASGRNATTAIAGPVGIEVKNYKGTEKTGQLVFKKDGFAYVGDSDDLQPIATRDLHTNLTDGHLLKWNSSKFRLEDSGKSVSDFALDSAVIKSVESTLLNVSTSDGKVTIAPATAKAEGKLYSSDEVPESTVKSLKYNGTFSASKVYAGKVELTGNTGTVKSVIAGDGLTGGTITETGTIAHATKEVSSGSLPEVFSGKVENTGRTVLSGISWDAFGHISGIKSTTLSDSDTWRPIKVNNAEVVGSNSNAAVELVSGANITMAVSEDKKITISSTDTNTWRDIQIKGATIGTENAFNITSETDSAIEISTKAENPGTAFISHKDASVTPGTYGVEAGKTTVGFGQSFTIPTFTVDKKGHLTDAGTKSITLPTPEASKNTTYDMFAGGANSTSAEVATNGSVHIHLKGSDQSDDKINIIGTGSAHVSCNENGVITINTPEQTECIDENVIQTEYSAEGARPVLMSSSSTPTSGGKAQAAYSTAITATGTGTLTAQKFVQGTAQVLDAAMVLILDGGNASSY